MSEGGLGLKIKPIKTGWIRSARNKAVGEEGINLVALGEKNN